MVDENSNNENGLDQEEEIDVYSDLYSTYTQVTSLTTNDVDNTTYPMTWKTVALLAAPQWVDYYLVTIQVSSRGIAQFKATGPWQSYHF